MPGDNGAQEDRVRAGNEAKAGERPSNTAPHRSVMIVDDDEGVRFFLTNYLRSLGITQIFEATNGQEAVDVARTYSDLSLVITDLKMPKMDGVETIRQLHALNPALPIIVLTAYPDYADIIEAARRGALFVMKPIELQALDQIVGGVLQLNPDR